jgi:hypothetical protein
MTRLKLLSAAALLTVILPLSTSSSLAQGPGPCTRPGNSAVGPEGPAMDSGQLMAGVGQCRRIGGWHDARRPYWRGAYGAYRRGPAPGWETTGFERDY